MIDVASRINIVYRCANYPVIWPTISRGEQEKEKEKAVLAPSGDLSALEWSMATIRLSQCFWNFNNLFTNH